MDELLFANRSPTREEVLETCSRLRRDSDFLLYASQESRRKSNEVIQRSGQRRFTMALCRDLWEGQLADAGRLATRAASGTTDEIPDR